MSPGLLAWLLPVAALLAAAWLTDRTQPFLPRPQGAEDPGCGLSALVFAVYLVILLLILRPSVAALQAAACRGASDVAECMDPSPADG